MADGQTKNISQYLTKNPAVAIQTIGVGVLIFNLYLASQLTPLVQDLRLLSDRVLAVEQIIPSVATSTIDIAVIRNQVEGIREDITEIKERIVGN